MMSGTPEYIKKTQKITETNYKNVGKDRSKPPKILKIIPNYKKSLVTFITTSIVTLQIT